MFTINDRQFIALGNAADEDLYQRIAVYLREKFDNIGDLSEAELLERVKVSALKAQGYGVKTDAGIARFVCVSFIAGAGFDELPEVNKYLTQPYIDGDSKMRLLLKNWAIYLDE